jgi:hypothetical protein
MRPRWPRAGLGWLAAAGTASLTSAEQAGCLRALEQAGSMHTAARARVLSVFHSRGGYEDDGHGSARSWPRWQTKISGGAVSAAMGWMKRLREHPAIAGALAAGEISESWGRQVCGWSDLLPADARGGADGILLRAAAGGAGLRDLEGLAEEMRQRTARPGTDRGGGFDERGVRLGITFRGAGKLGGDLTPRCAATAPRPPAGSCPGGPPAS